MALEKGDQLPSFELPNQNGEIFNIDTVKGKKKVVIYFYPKDDTYGCTKEACSFRDNYEDFQELGCEVIGISSDSTESHDKFATKHNLPFILLSDKNKEVRKLFGVKGNLLGLIPGRETFVFDQEGKLLHKFNAQMESSKHMEEAKKILENLVA